VPLSFWAAWLETMFVLLELELLGWGCLPDFVGEELVDWFQIADLFDFEGGCGCGWCSEGSVAKSVDQW
jgi:hypothetical protein